MAMGVFFQGVRVSVLAAFLGVVSVIAGNGVNGDSVTGREAAADCDSGDIHRVSDLSACDADETGCLSKCTEWYSVQSTESDEGISLNFIAKNLSDAGCECSNGVGLGATDPISVLFKDGVPDGTASISWEGVIVGGSPGFNLSIPNPGVECTGLYQVTKGCLLNVTAPSPNAPSVQGSPELKVLVVLLLGISVFIIVAVFLYGYFATDKTVYIELDG